MARNKKQKQRVRKRKKRSPVKLPPFGRKHWIVLGALLLATFICFSPVLDNEFVNWDDEFNIHDNPNLTVLNWDNVKNIFTSHVIGNYNPLTILSFAIEKHLVGLDDPWLFHFNNLLLHLICILLVFRIGQYLGLNLWGAALLAALFAVHPMRVESVAWVTERKDVLYGAFFLGALLYYIKGKRNGKNYLWIILPLFILALLSKIQAVTLPLSMLACDYLLEKRWKWSFAWQKWHYFLLSLLTGLVGIYFLGQQGSINADRQYDFVERIVIGTYSLGVYLVKAVIPYEHSPLYPYPGVFPWYMYLGIPATVLFLAAVAWFWKKNNKPVVFGLLFFLLNIFFLLQFLGAGQGFLADRFTYIAYLGLFFIPAWYFQRAKGLGVKWRNIALAAVSAYMLLMAVISYRLCDVWQDSATLWTHVISHYPNATLPYGNRGNYYRDTGMPDKALEDYDMAIKLEPDRHATLNSRGKLYFDRGEYQKAIENYNRSIAIEPNNAEYYVNRGAALAALGQYDQALQDLNKGLERKPSHLTGYINRFIVKTQLGQYQSALEDVNEYLRRDPYNADMHYEKALLLRRLDRTPDALPVLNQAISMNPNKGLYYLERSRVHATLGNRQAAKQDALKARQLGQAVDQNYIDAL